MTPNKPNVLFVVLDSARPDWLSCYESLKGPVSPNIDMLAHAGWLFETAISPSSWTFPVMASVFTGMLPAKHGGHDQHLLLDSPYPTMAEIFSRHGYDTAAFADIPYVGPLTKLDRGFRTMSNLHGSQVTLRSRLLKGIGKLHRTVTGRYCKTGETPVVIGEAMNWLNRVRDPRKPFLLYIHSDETHAPFLPPGRYRKRFTGLTARQMHATNKDKQRFVAGLETMTDKERKDLWKLALAEVAYFDEWLGRLFDFLRRNRLFDDTIIVITADHGENMGEHGLLRHAMCLYDTLLHVPLIIKPAGGCKPQRVHPMVQLIDLLPTLMSMTGVEDLASTEFQGIDLQRRMTEEAYPEYVIAELYPPPNKPMWAKKVPQFMDQFGEKYDRLFRAVRTNTHKYIWASPGPHELYGLVQDPGEEQNLIDREPTIADDLRRKLNQWLASFPHADARVPDGENIEADDLVTNRLRDLGYIE